MEGCRRDELRSDPYEKAMAWRALFEGTTGSRLRVLVVSAAQYHTPGEQPLKPRHKNAEYRLATRGTPITTITLSPGGITVATSQCHIPEERPHYGAKY